jgi:hypothetical protein
MIFRIDTGFAGLFVVKLCFTGEALSKWAAPPPLRQRQSRELPKSHKGKAELFRK